MTKPTVDDDLTLAFILGRDGGGLSFTGSVALGFVGCLGMGAAAATGLVSGGPAFACLVLVVAVVAWWSSPAAAAVCAVVAFLFAVGFVFDSGGVLDWHGEADLLRLVSIVAIALSVSILGSGRRARLRDEVERMARRRAVAS